MKDEFGALTEVLTTLTTPVQFLCRVDFLTGVTIWAGGAYFPTVMLGNDGLLLRTSSLMTKANHPGLPTVSVFAVTVQGI